MEIIQYAVRVKGTQMYLPRPQRADGRGGSHLEPMDFSDIENMPVADRYRRNMLIRTFTKESAAKNVLNSWLEGKWYGDSEGDVWMRKVENRRREDMEIVTLRLVLPPV